MHCNLILKKIKEISKYYNVVGMHLYTFNDNRIICRNFAPLYDINEEAATELQTVH